MSIPFDPASASSPGQMMAAPGAQNRLLWAAVAVLGVAVLAMGGVLIRSQTSTPAASATPAAAAAPTVAVAVPTVAAPAAPQPAQESPATVASPAAVAAPVAATAKTADPGAAKAAAKPVPATPAKPAPTLVQKGQDKAPAANDAARPVGVVAVAAAGPDAVPPPAPTAGPAPAADPSPPQGKVYSSEPAGTVIAHPAHTTPVVVAAPPTQAPLQARPLCINCGTVEAVNAVQQAGTPGGLGALAGGLLGAVVGNQVGQGGGRTLATVLGAVGGGLAGNTVEKGMNKSLQYEVRVRMDDGSVRNLQQATAVAVGDKVLIDNGVLRPAPRTSPDMPSHSVVGGQSAPVRLGPSN